MKPEEVLYRLNHECKFPNHGWIADSDNCVYLVFPILRALGITVEGTPKFPARTEFRMRFFELLFREKILLILGQIARAEKTLLRYPSLDGLPAEDAQKVDYAQKFLPIWVDSIYIYFRMLADRLASALVPLVSKSGRQIPSQYDKLLKKSEDQAINNYEWKVNGDTFMSAIRENSSWFSILTSPQGGGKGIRDAILHRLADTAVIREVDPKGHTRRVMLNFQSIESDVPTEIDILSTITEIIEGFCKFLSGLPLDLWEEKQFNMLDINYRSNGEWIPVQTFFPRLL